MNAYNTLVHVHNAIVVTHNAAVLKHNAPILIAEAKETLAKAKTKLADSKIARAIKHEHKNDPSTIIYIIHQDDGTYHSAASKVEAKRQRYHQ